MPTVYEDAKTFFFFLLQTYARIIGCLEDLGDNLDSKHVLTGHRVLRRYIHRRDNGERGVAIILAAKSNP